jgi:TrmH family RNA methyltransferase
VVLAPPITSRRNPLVSRFRAAAGGDGETMLLDGDHLVTAALDADVAIDVVALVVDRMPPALVARLTAVLPPARLVPVTPAVLEALSPVRTPSGIVALAGRPRRTARDVLQGPGVLAIAAVDVQDPGNVGGIIRSAEAGGASAVIATGGSADPFGWKALRGSMGSAFRLPISRIDSIEIALDAAREAGCQIVAAAGAATTSLYDVDLRQPSLVLLGREGEGLGEAVLARADVRLAIPMERPVESLNVAVAAGVIVYEARRQRRDC